MAVVDVLLVAVGVHEAVVDAYEAEGDAHEVKEDELLFVCVDDSCLVEVTSVSHCIRAMA